MTTSKNVFSKLEIMIFFKFFQGYLFSAFLTPPRGSSAPPLEYRPYWGLAPKISGTTPVKNMKIRLCSSHLRWTHRGWLEVSRTHRAKRVRETSSHPRCVQSRTHRTHTHCSSLRYIRRCFVNIFSAKKVAGLLILLYLRLDYLYCIFFFLFLQSHQVSQRKKFCKV